MTRFGILIDQERCIGCESCTMACKLENRTTGIPWIRVETVGGGRKDAPAGDYPELKMDFLPRLCMHCQQPPCVDSCPTSALQKRKDGLVLLNQQDCTGCQACIDACPYDAISFNQDKGVAEKCTLCAHRVDQGIEPFCVRCCEGQAMHFGDLDDPGGAIARAAAGGRTFTLKPEAGTGPSIIYGAPRPKRKL